MPSGIGIGVSPFLKRGGGPPAPITTNATVQAWINKIGAAGYVYPSQSKVDIYTSAWDYADAQGLTTQFDLVGLLKVENVNLCKIPFIHSGGSSKRFTLVNSPTFTANKGLKGTGSAGYLATAWIESTDAVQYQLGNACVFLSTDYTLASSDYAMGTVTTVSNQFSPFFSGFNKIIAWVSNNGAGGVLVTNGAVVATAVGNSSVTYTGGVGKVFRNGVQSGSNQAQTGAATVKANIQDYVLSVNNNGSPNASYPGDVSLFIKAIGTINQANLNTFANMLLL